MGISSRTVFYTTGLVSFGGYLLVHRELTKLYPDVPLYELPPNSRIRQVFDYRKKDPSKYVPYCDTFRIQIKTNKNLDEISSQFLSFPALAKIIANKENPEGGSVALKAEITDEKVDKKNQYKSTLIKWGFKNQSIITFFEKLASYGYPWRLMNGGYHEVYVERVKGAAAGDGVYDVYFASAHEYNDLRDGKFQPFQSLHRDYARILLHLAFYKDAITKK